MICCFSAVHIRHNQKRQRGRKETYSFINSWLPSVTILEKQKRTHRESQKALLILVHGECSMPRQAITCHTGVNRNGAENKRQGLRKRLPIACSVLQASWKSTDCQEAAQAHASLRVSKNGNFRSLYSCTAAFDPHAARS